MRFGRIAVCVKHVPSRVEVDPLTGGVTTFANEAGMSDADSAALALGLSLADEVTVVCVGGSGADRTLREALAAGARRAVRCPADSSGHASSFEVARALGSVVGDDDLVLCGAYSLDRGSGSVPAFLAAALGVGQALGCVRVASVEGGLRVERRLERGRREVLLVDRRAVVSVEGSVARLGRAALAAVLAAQQHVIELGPPVLVEPPMGALVPHRPRVKLSHGPDPAAGALDRIRQLTDLTAGSVAARAVALEPFAAAEAILDQLAQWGYVPSSPGRRPPE